MEEEPPFVPMGRDTDATYFPKASDQDEDLKLIVNDKKQVNTETVKDFNNFGGVSYHTLKSINEKEAKRALDKA